MKFSSNRRLFLQSSGSLLISGISTALYGSVYPDRPIRFVVPYPPGGGTDVIARIIQGPLSDYLNTQIFIDNRGGAGGTIGTELVAKSLPDGYTVLFTLSSHTINPAIFSNLKFDTETDFLPVSLVASLPQVLVSNHSFPANTIQDVVTLAKKNPGAIMYGSVGNGTPGHLAGEMMALKAKIKMTHVPYRGGGPAVADLLANHIGLLWVSIPAVSAHINSGKLRPLAVSTSNRALSFPNIPTMAESGFIDFNVDSWYAMFAPAGTPKSIINRLNQGVSFVCSRPEIKEKLLKQGAESIGSTTEELNNTVKIEILKWKKLVRTVDIKID